ncbi:inorganic diphosphatase [Candidatus Woesearchaeota archaeon]|nr:inorganic diphosphatase [Candidatus Woesearchaeota archaeon]
MEKNYATKFLGKEVYVKIDRPLGSKHPKHDIIYELNYGFLPNTTAPDGEEIDAYILGIKESITEFKGICKAIIKRTNDDDDKLIVTPRNYEITKEEIINQTFFQEKYFKSELIILN